MSSYIDNAMTQQQITILTGYKSELQLSHTNVQKCTQHLLVVVSVLGLPGLSDEVLQLIQFIL